MSLALTHDRLAVTLAPAAGLSIRTMLSPLAIDLQHGIKPRTMNLPPDKQPPGGGGWKLKLAETGGTVTGEDFGKFVVAVNDQLRANGFDTLSWETILERTRDAGA